MIHVLTLSGEVEQNIQVTKRLHNYVNTEKCRDNQEDNNCINF